MILNKIKHVIVNGNPAIQMYLTLKKATLIDPEDYDKVKDKRWIAKRKDSKYFYCVSLSTNPITKKRISTSLNRVILDIHDKDKKIFYKNGLSLDNRKRNMIILDRSIKHGLRKRKVSSSSGYRGVFWKKDRQSYHVAIKFNGVRYSLGTFKNKARAAIVYDKAAQHYIGELAITNFKPGLKKNHLKVRTIDF